MANFLFCFTTLLVILRIAVSHEPPEEYKDCTRRDHLIKALFETGLNLNELDRVFFPPRKQTSRYIKVHYTFLDNNGFDPGNCTVTYIWAIGGFLLVQPPKIFRLTSLLFSTPANKLENLNLQLPSACKELVFNETKSLHNCSCKGNDKFSLNRLTQQLNVLSTYGNPSQVMQDIESSAQAVCEDDLKDTYFSGNEIHLFFSLIVFLPIIIMLVLAIVIRSTHKFVHTELTKSSIHHPMFAGVTLAGVHVLLFVLFLDAAAIHFYSKKKYENSNDGVDKTLNLFVVFITISMDVIVSVQFLFCMLYLACSRAYKDNYCNCKCCKDDCVCCCERFLPCLLAPYFYIIFGSNKQIGKWKVQNHAHANAENKLNLWVLTGTVVAPLFCIASHAGYILIAWVTEPAKTTAAFLVALGSLLYLFFVFRQCYIVHRDAEQQQQQAQEAEEEQGGVREKPTKCSCCIRSSINLELYCKKYWMVWFLFFPIITIPLFSLYTLCICYNYAFCQKCCRLCKKPTDDDTLENFWKSVEVTDDAMTNENVFSIKGFCTACSWGWLIVGCLAFFISAFHVLPVSTIQLAQYLENTIQIVIVALAFLVTYKIFSVEETAIRKFMRKLRSNYHTEDVADDAEAAGAMLNGVVLDSSNLVLLQGLNIDNNETTRNLLLNLYTSNLKLLLQLTANNRDNILRLSNLQILLRLDPNNSLEVLQPNPDNLSCILKLAPANLNLLLQLDVQPPLPERPDNLTLLLRLTPDVLNRILQLNPPSLQLFLKLDPNNVDPPQPQRPDNLNLILKLTPNLILTPNILNRILQLDPPSLQLLLRLTTDNLNLLLRLTTDNLNLLLSLTPNILNRILKLDPPSLQHLLQLDPNNIPGLLPNNIPGHQPQHDNVALNRILRLGDFLFGEARTTDILNHIFIQDNLHELTHDNIDNYLPQP